MMETTNYTERVTERSWLYEDIGKDIEKMRCEVATEIERLAGNLEGEWQDRDSPSEVEIREVEYRHREALRTRLRHLDEALERLRHKTYGTCIDCHRRIPSRRLLNDVTVSRCLACQTVADEPVPDYSI